MNPTRCDSKIMSCPIELPPDVAAPEKPVTSAPANASTDDTHAPAERVAAGASDRARLVQRQGASETGARGGSGGDSPAGTKGGKVTEFASKACEVAVEIGARFALARFAHIHGLKGELMGKGIAMAVCPSPTPETVAPPPPAPPTSNGAGGAPAN